MQRNFWSDIFKAVLIGLCLSLVFTLMVALVSTMVEIPMGTIQALSLLAKISAVVIASFLSARKEKGWLKGLLSAIILGLLMFIVFSLIEGQFIFNLRFLINMGFYVIFGIISGIFGVNCNKV